MKTTVADLLKEYVRQGSLGDSGPPDPPGRGRTRGRGARTQNAAYNPRSTTRRGVDMSTPARDERAAEAAEEARRIAEERRLAREREAAEERRRAELERVRVGKMEEERKRRLLQQGAAESMLSPEPPILTREPEVRNINPRLAMPGVSNVIPAVERTPLGSAMATQQANAELDRDRIQAEYDELSPVKRGAAAVGRAILGGVTLGAPENMPFVDENKLAAYDQVEKAPWEQLVRGGVTLPAAGASLYGLSKGIGLQNAGVRAIGSRVAPRTTGRVLAALEAPGLAGRLARGGANAVEGAAIDYGMARPGDEALEVGFGAAVGGGLGLAMPGASPIKRAVADYIGQRGAPNAAGSTLPIDRPLDTSFGIGGVDRAAEVPQARPAVSAGGETGDRVQSYLTAAPAARELEPLGPTPDTSPRPVQRKPVITDLSTRHSMGQTLPEEAFQKPDGRSYFNEVVSQRGEEAPVVETALRGLVSGTGDMRAHLAVIGEDASALRAAHDFLLDKMPTNPEAREKAELLQKLIEQTVTRPPKGNTSGSTLLEAVPRIPEIVGDKVKPVDPNAPEPQRVGVMLENLRRLADAFVTRAGIPKAMALDWYGGAVGVERAIMRIVQPERRSDAIHVIATAVHSILSNGQQVPMESDMGMRIVEQWLRTGNLSLLDVAKGERFTTQMVRKNGSVVGQPGIVGEATGGFPGEKGFGATKSVTHEVNLQRLQDVIDRHGIEGAADHITGRGYYSPEKRPTSGKNKGQIVPPALNSVDLFGPKIGQYMADKLGIPGEGSTIDLWMARMYYVLKGEPPKTKIATAEDVAKAAEERKKKAAAKASDDAEDVDTDDEDLISFKEGDVILDDTVPKQMREEMQAVLLAYAQSTGGLPSSAQALAWYVIKDLFAQAGAAQKAGAYDTLASAARGSVLAPLRPEGNPINMGMPKPGQQTLGESEPGLVDLKYQGMKQDVVKRRRQAGGRQLFMDPDPAGMRAEFPGDEQYPEPGTVWAEDRAPDKSTAGTPRGWKQKNPEGQAGDSVMANLRETGPERSPKILDLRASRGGKLIATDGTEITPADEVIVFHATDKDTATRMVQAGIDPAQKPTNLARQRYEAGEASEFGPGRGLARGLTVGSNVHDVSGYGRETLAIRVPASDLRVSPEQAALGETDPLGAFRVSDAVVERPINPADIRLLSEAEALGKEPVQWGAPAASAASPFPRNMDEYEAALDEGRDPIGDRFVFHVTDADQIEARGEPIWFSASGPTRPGNVFLVDKTKLNPELMERPGTGRHIRYTGPIPEDAVVPLGNREGRVSVREVVEAVNTRNDAGFAQPELMRAIARTGAGAVGGGAADALLGEDDPSWEGAVAGAIAGAVGPAAARGLRKITPDTKGVMGGTATPDAAAVPDGLTDDEIASILGHARKETVTPGATSRERAPATPLANVDEIDSEGVNPSDYVNIAKVTTDPAGQKRLAEEVQRMVADHPDLDPKRVVGWKQQIADSLGLDAEDVLTDPASIADRKHALAARNIIKTNLEQVTRIERTLNENAVLPEEARQELYQLRNALEVQNLALLDRFTRARSEAGRTLNSYKILATRTFDPSDPVPWLAKAKDLAGGDYTDDVRVEVMRFLGKGDKAGLFRFLSGLRRASVQEKGVTLWKAGLLTNPLTHIVNIAGNTTHIGLLALAQTPTAMVDWALSKATGLRTESFLTRQMAAESLKGANEGRKQAWMILKGVPLEDALKKWDIPKDVNFDNAVLQAYTQGVFRLLGAQDRIFRSAALQFSLANQAEVMARNAGLKGAARKEEVQRLLQNPTDAMALRAIHDAEIATFQNQTASYQLLKGMTGQNSDRWPKEIPRATKQAVKTAGSLVVPFQRTPAALGERLISYSPIGLGAGMVDVGRLLLNNVPKGEIPEVQMRAARRLGRAGSATASLVLTGYLLHKAGRATGSFAPGDEEAGTNQQEQVPRNAIKYGDSWYEVGRLGPPGMLLALGANIAAGIETGVSPTDKAARGAMGAAKIMLDQPMMQGMKTVMDATSNPGTMGARFVNNLAGSTVPAVVAAGVRATDPNYYEVDGPVDAIRSRLGATDEIPALGLEKMEPRRTPLGDTVEHDTGVSSMLNPLRQSRDQLQDDPVLQALNEYNVPVRPVDRIKAEPGAERSKRQARVGGTVRASIEKIISDTPPPEPPENASDSRWAQWEQDMARWEAWRNDQARAQEVFDRAEELALEGYTQDDIPDLIRQGWSQEEVKPLMYQGWPVDELAKHHRRKILQAAVNDAKGTEARSEAQLPLQLQKKLDRLKRSRQQARRARGPSGDIDLNDRTK